MSGKMKFGKVTTLLQCHPNSILAWNKLNPIRPGIFSRSPGPRGGMPKIKVNINRLKWNFVWVIVAVKGSLMQNLRVILSSRFGDMTSQNICQKKGTSHQIRLFNFKKNEFLCPESFFSTQNWPPPPPMSISAIKSRGKFFHFQNFWTSRWEYSSSNPPDWSILLKFGQNVS